MNFTTDTEWAVSARGNQWRRIDGKVLVVGTKDEINYWAMIDGTFLDEKFESAEQAQSALEDKVNGDGDLWGNSHD
jgi:hypothetical protein